MKYLLLRLKRFCGFATGFIFFISGILKVLDPVGAGLVMSEYMDFLHLGFLKFASKLSGTAFAFAEIVIGTGLITGIFRKAFAIIAFAFQAFFTILTLLLVIFNPSMDCGCFGEAFHLSHMQTFVKNLILLSLLAIYTFPLRMFGANKRRKYVSFSIVTASALAFTIYSWLYIPLTDFTVYKPGAALEALEVVAESESERYEAVFIYEKDGVQEKFDLGHLPDTTWTYVGTEMLTKEGFKDDQLMSLSFCNAEGEYLDSLAANGKVMVVSVYDKDIKASRWEEIYGFMEHAAECGFRPLLLVAATPDQIGGNIPDFMYFSDYKTLITMNRSNGGATYFSNGYLIRKWARRSLPDMNELMDFYKADETETIIDQDTRGSLTLQGFLLYVFAVMLLL